jgi:formamidopyrimidine-DNA glycosylase
VPELPEVETVRGALSPVIEGARLEDVEIRDPRLVRPFDPSIVAAALVGERVAGVGRRGKYLIFRFSSDRSLLVHLRMTGSFRAAARGTLADGPHTRAVLRLDNGSDVAYHDVRRFGTWELFENGELQPYLEARLGPEPLGRLTATQLGNRLEGRRAPLKSALLDQRRIAGLGNIYVDEALWISRLHPLRPAGSLLPEELRSLHRAIRSTLRRAIERQGSTLRDYAQPDGSYGSMQEEFRAYGRGGEPCDRCSGPLVRIVVGGRATTFCPECQSASPASSAERPNASPAVGYAAGRSASAPERCSAASSS